MFYFERCGVEVWSKFRPNFDTPSVEVWSKFGRSLVAFLSNLHCISLIYGANFDQTSTLGGVEVWVEISTKLRHWGVEVWSKFRPNFDTHIVQTSKQSLSLSIYIYIYIYIYI